MVKEGEVECLFATRDVSPGKYLCEYKGLLYPASEKSRHKEEYRLKGHIITVWLSAPVSQYHCVDATMCFKSKGR